VSSGKGRNPTSRVKRERYDTCCFAYVRNTQRY